MDSSHGGVEGGGSGVQGTYMAADNYSYPQPPWLLAYLECTVAVSQSLNLTVEDSVWLSLLNGANNATALGTMVMEATEGLSRGVPSSTSAPFSHNDTVYHYRTSALLGEPTELSPFTQDSLGGVMGSFNDARTTLALPAPSPATSPLAPSDGNVTDDLIRIVNAVASWCLDEVTPHQRPYLLAWWQQALWLLAFGLMLFVAIGGNALVMWIVTGESASAWLLLYFIKQYVFYFPRLEMNQSRV